MRLSTSVALLAALAVPGSLLLAQGSHDPAHHKQPGDSAFAAMQARGKQAMNVDQERSTHRFTTLPDGGQIELISDTDDSTAISGIRRHFVEIRKAFTLGDFSTPWAVHAEAVPGTTVMKSKAADIRYQMLEVPRGARLRITTTNAAALAAVHQFLAFQRSEHHAGQ